jgi:site-specific DNA recombinase
MNHDVERGDNLKTVAYYRHSISKEKQKTSMDLQKNEVRALAHKKRILIDDEFKDEETSARKTKTEERKDMNRLIQEIKKGNIKTILVYSRSRLARNVSQHMTLFRLLKEHDVEVLFAAEHEFPMMYTEEGEFIERIMAAFNQHEGENIVKGLIESKRTKAKGGKHAAGRISYGYRSPADKESLDDNNPENDEDWIIIEDEVKIIRSIYRLFMEENFKNFNRFVGIVNKKGFQFKGKAWSYGNLKTLLTNPIYKGLRVYKEIERDVPHLKIIEEDEWDLVQARIDFYFPEKEKVEKPETEEIIFLLSGLITCLECNENFINRTYKRNETTIGIYQCKQHTKLKINKDEIESETIRLANLFFNQLLSPQFSKVVKEMIEKEVKIHESILGFIENVRTDLYSKVGSQIDILLEIENESDIPYEILKSYKQLTEHTETYLTFKDKRYESMETLNELIQYQKEYKDSKDIITNELEKEMVQEILENIIDGIYISENKKAQIIFKHPYVDSVGGKEIVDLK